MKKLLSLMLLCMVCMGAWADGITDLSQLSNNKVYAIRTASTETARGSLYYDSRYTGYLSATGTFWQNGTDIYSADNNNCKFAIYKSAVTGYYYFYSIGAGKFVKSDGEHARLTDAVEQTISFTNATSAKKTTNPWVIQFNRGGGDYLGITNWAYWSSKTDKTPVGAITYDKNAGDAGTNMAIVEVEDISPSALTAIESGVYAAEATIISALQEKIDALFAMGGKINSVGYPRYDASCVTALMLYSTYYGDGVTVDNYDDALEAYNAVLAETNIVLPEDGKAYTIKAKFQNGTYKYVVNGSNNLLSHSDNADTKWVANKVGDKFVLADAETGKYFYVESQSHKNDLMDKTAYDETRAQLTIAKVNPTHGQNWSNATSADLFGCLTIKAKSAGNDTFSLLAGTDESFRNGYENDYYYDYAAFSGSNYRSCEFIFEEVENPNVLKLTKPESTHQGGLNGKYVGTFSAPYAVELPADVKAYKAEINDAKTVVTFNEIEGTVVPKNTGVLLYAESGVPESATNAIPAATATLPTVSNNIFEPMVNGNITAGNLVLGYTADEGVMFYPLAEDKAVRNKAYISSTNNVSSFRFDFEEQTTGISATQATIENGVAFDLAGRRINANAKGISIMNGQKVIR